MSEPPVAPDVTRRDTYRIWGTERVRYSDTDAHGHVNNVSFAAYLETGRTVLAQALGLPIGLHSGMHTVLARVEIDYRAELHWPASLDLGATVVRIGRSSVTVIQGIFHGDLCVATGREVLVMVDTATGKSAPLPEALCARLLRDGGPLHEPHASTW
jgi:acyl-CoA thioester hydrolase